MPGAVASRKGVSKLAAEAEAHRVVLTSHGRPIAVVDSAERLDENLRRVREASRPVVETAGELVLGRSNQFALEDVCAIRWEALSLLDIVTEDVGLEGWDY